ncbi:unnamed protein product [Rhodiola kirilowii]
MEVVSFSQAGVANWSSRSAAAAESVIPGKLRVYLRPRSLELNFAVTKSAKTLFVQRGGESFRKERCIKIACCRNLQVPVLQARYRAFLWTKYMTLWPERLVPTAAVASNPNRKYIVGLAAPPGAWKKHSIPGSSSAGKTSYGTKELDAMEDPEEAHARRGAPWTFDPARMMNCLKDLREHGSVYAPSFDHGKGDPVEDDVFFVIVEGNYLLLGDGIWKDMSSMFDEKWFIDIEINKSMQRVLRRHILTGKPPDVAKWRVEYNDRPNAELILKSKTNADLIIRSIDYTN